MEVAHPAITALQPVNKQLTLQDNTLIIVPAFAVRAMIVDILTNSDLMKKENILVGYNIFTGYVDDNHEANPYW